MFQLQWGFNNLRSTPIDADWQNVLVTVLKDGCRRSWKPNQGNVGSFAVDRGNGEPDSDIVFGLNCDNLAFSVSKQGKHVGGEYSFCSLLYALTDSTLSWIAVTMFGFKYIKGQTV